MDLSQLLPLNIVDPRRLDEQREVCEADIALLRAKNDLTMVDAVRRFCCEEFQYEVIGQRLGEMYVAVGVSFNEISENRPFCRTRVFATSLNETDSLLSLVLLIVDRQAELFYSSDELHRFVHSERIKSYQSSLSQLLQQLQQKLRRRTRSVSRRRMTGQHMRGETDRLNNSFVLDAATLRLIKSIANDAQLKREVLFESSVIRALQKKIDDFRQFQDLIEEQSGSIVADARIIRNTIANSSGMRSVLETIEKFREIHSLIDCSQVVRAWREFCQSSEFRRLRQSIQAMNSTQGVLCDLSSARIACNLDKTARGLREIQGAAEQYRLE